MITRAALVRLHALIARPGHKAPDQSLREHRRRALWLRSKRRELHFETAGAKPEGTPQHQAFLYLAWSPIEALTITPSLELAGDRYSVVTSEALAPNAFIPRYIHAGSYALLNIQAEYQFTDNFSAAIGGTNLTDQNYALAEGFPEAGRQFFANARIKF